MVKPKSAKQKRSCFFDRAVCLIDDTVVEEETKLRYKKQRVERGDGENGTVLVARRDDD
jgi:hypothetical protein